MSFKREIARSMISGTCAGFLTDAVMNGIFGGEKLDKADALLSGIQGGVVFISSPLAIKALEKCPHYKEICKKEGFKYRAIQVIEEGVVQSAILAALNYPIQVIRDSRKAKDPKTVHFCPKAMGKFFVDQVPSNIGFGATMTFFAPRIAVPKNSLAQWVRSSGLVAGSVLGGNILSYPLHKIRDGQEFMPIIKSFPTTAFAVTFNGDAFGHFLGITKFLVE